MHTTNTIHPTTIIISIQTSIVVRIVILHQWYSMSSSNTNNAISDTNYFANTTDDRS